MQDRINQLDENLLHRTAGPYRCIKSTHYRTATAMAGSPQMSGHSKACSATSDEDWP
jgi:hypothetical protein